MALARLSVQTITFTFNSKEFLLFLYAMCMLSWGRALGPFRGLSTKQLLLPAPYGKEEKRMSVMVFNTSSYSYMVSQAYRILVALTLASIRSLTLNDGSLITEPALTRHDHFENHRQTPPPTITPWKEPPRNNHHH